MDHKQSARRRAESRGRRAEWLAIALLSLKGYRILAHRLKTPLGEIDIIARRGRLTAFIEVKQRETVEGGLAAILPQQHARLLRAAQWWLARH